MKNVLVITEFDYENKETITIGVSDSVEEAERMVKEYYGPENISVDRFDDIGENLESSRTLTIQDDIGIYGPQRVRVDMEWFSVNRV